MHNVVGNPIISGVLAVLLGLWAFFLIAPPENFNLPELPLTARTDDSIAIRVLKGAAGVNFAVSSYMLVGPPIVIEKDMSDYKTWLGSTGVNGLSWGPLIWLHDGLSEATRTRVLRHEYQHFCQFAVLTPFGMWLVTGIEGVFLYIKHEGDLREIYMDQWCEKDARKHQHDGLEFNYVLLTDGNTLFVRPNFQLAPMFEPKLHIDIQRSGITTNLREVSL
jgi:hypothetical protein